MTPGIFEFGQHKSPYVRWIVRGVGMRDPRPDVMGNDVDSFRAREVGRFKEAMQVACGCVEIVTADRLVAFTETTGIEDDDTAARVDQQRQDFPPGDPAFRPPRKQQHRIAGPRRDVVEAYAVDLHDVVFGAARFSRALCKRVRREHGAGHDCGKRSDEHGHCILTIGSPRRSGIVGKPICWLG